MDRLTATVVHDLKNSTALLVADLVHAARLDPENAALHLALRRSAGLSSRLVEFLTYQQAKHGELAADANACSPERTVQEAASDAWRHVPDHIEVEMQVAGSTPSFWVYDEYLVQLVLSAALHNAGRFAKTRATVGSELRDGMLVLFVEDDGAGLGSAPVNCQEDRSTGLGTALSTAIAEAHENKGRKGLVRLFTKPAGGARFELLLP